MFRMIITSSIIIHQSSSSSSQEKKKTEGGGMILIVSSSASSLPSSLHCRASHSSHTHTHIKQNPHITNISRRCDHFHHSWAAAGTAALLSGGKALSEASDATGCCAAGTAPALAPPPAAFPGAAAPPRPPWRPRPACVPRDGRCWWPCRPPRREPWPAAEPAPCICICCCCCWENCCWVAAPNACCICACEFKAMACMEAPCWR